MPLVILGSPPTKIQESAFLVLLHRGGRVNRNFGHAMRTGVGPKILKSKKTKKEIWADDLQ